MAATPTTTGEGTLLSASDLAKSFGARQALRGVSFSAAPGELVAIVGPNGAGKTTLLQLLAGSLQPDEGSVSIPAGEVGWVPQHPALYGKLTAAENLRLFARLEKVPDVAAAVGRMLEQTGLTDRAGDQVARLSGGNRQRLNIAIGLLGSPRVLLLDEPSSSLDPRQREVLWHYVARLAAEGTTVVYTSHDVGEVERHADRVLVLADGDLLFTGTPAQLQLTVGGDRDFEGAFVSFLHQRGH